MTTQLCVRRGDLWSWGSLLIAVWLERSQTDSHSLACAAALSIPCTSQHSSTVNKGCSVSASGGSIIYAFYRLPNPLSSAPVSSHPLTLQVESAHRQRAASFFGHILHVDKQSLRIPLCVAQTPFLCVFWCVRLALKVIMCVFLGGF